MREEILDRGNQFDPSHGIRALGKQLKEIEIDIQKTAIKEATGNMIRTRMHSTRRASSHSAVPQRTMAFIKTRSVGGKYKRSSKRGESNENRKKTVLIVRF